MEQEEAVGPPGTVALVEGLDALEGARRCTFILGHVLLRGVGEVGEQGEAELGIGVGQVVDLQPLEQHRGALGPDQHRGHDDERGATRRESRP